MKIFFIFFVAFPTAFSYFVVYYIKHPKSADAELVYIFAPLFLVFTILSQIFGAKFINKIKDPGMKKKYTQARYAGLIIGLMFLGMFFFILK